jgi:hypothetical protein
LSARFWLEVAADAASVLAANDDDDEVGASSGRARPSLSRILLTVAPVVALLR